MQRKTGLYDSFKNIGICKATVRPIMTYALEIMAEISKTIQTLEANEMTVLRKIVDQQIRESCGIKPIDKRAERRRREWDEHITRMDTERLVKISGDNIPVGRSPERPKRR